MLQQIEERGRDHPTGRGGAAHGGIRGIADGDAAGMADQPVVRFAAKDAAVEAWVVGALAGAGVIRQLGQIDGAGSHGAGQGSALSGLHLQRARCQPDASAAVGAKPTSDDLYLEPLPDVRRFRGFGVQWFKVQASSVKSEIENQESTIPFG